MRAVGQARRIHALNRHRHPALQNNLSTEVRRECVVILHRWDHRRNELQEEEQILIHLRTKHERVSRAPVHMQPQVSTLDSVERSTAPVVLSRPRRADP